MSEININPENKNLSTCNFATQVIEVISPKTGKTWMDRNLGAQRVATTLTDQQAYGDLYQWGRNKDGHQCRDSRTFTERSSVNSTSHGLFIIITNFTGVVQNFENWLISANPNLWQGEKGINNPCPTGFRVPTISELNAERSSWQSNTASGAFSSPLKLTMAGYRSRRTGAILAQDAVGIFWSSTVNGGSSQILQIDSGIALVNSLPRAEGYSVRCIKN